MKQIIVTVPTNGPHTVRLYFAEPDTKAQPGDRIFSVSLGKKEVLSNLDIVRETGAPRNVVVKEFSSVKIDSTLELSFITGKGKPLVCGVEIILEKEIAKPKP